MALATTFVKDPEAVLDYTIRWGAANWAQATPYVPGDYVYDPEDGLFYVCNAKHTSDAAGTRSADAAFWEEVEDGLWLDGAADEQITTAAFTVPAGLTKDSETNDGYAATVWLSGGSDGTTYEIIVNIDTNNSPVRTDERTFKVKVKQK